MSFESTDFCMRRKCKMCPLNTECDILSNTARWQNRLVYLPFENLKEILEKRINHK